MNIYREYLQRSLEAQMNIVELLKEQHAEAKELFERIIGAEDEPKEARTLLAELSKALRLHMQIEEKLVYPAAARAFAGDEDDEESVLEAFEEHAVARRSLEALEATPPSDKRFVVRAKVLKELILHHVEEEEKELLPELESKLGKEGAERLGEQAERKKPQFESEAQRGRSSSMTSRSSVRAARGAGGARVRRTGGSAAGRATKRRASARKASKSKSRGR